MEADGPKTEEEHMTTEAGEVATSDHTFRNQDTKITQQVMTENSPQGDGHF